MDNKSKRQLAYFLIFCLIVVYFQVIVGGITRLTESGLSMTDWNIVTGVVPPMGNEAWDAEFAKYKESPQYKEVNQGMSIGEFKYIYFWEWFHRVWGRVGFMLLFGAFVYFLARKKLDTTNVKRFVILLLFYIAQGFLGWFMVKSGLSDRPEVSHYRLTAHLLLAIFLFTYILWFFNSLLSDNKQKVEHKKYLRYTWGLVGLLVVQIIFGGFMSGLEAATHYPTFPDMNGEIVPSNLFDMQPFWLSFLEHIPTIQFIHRNLAYLLLIIILAYWANVKSIASHFNNRFFSNALNALPIILLLQVSLGILVLINAIGTVPVFLGVAHQAIGLLLLSTVVFIGFQFKYK